MTHAAPPSSPADASSRSTTDTYTWANSVAFKTAWGYKFSFKGSYPMLGDITDEVTINFDKTWTNNWWEDFAQAHYYAVVASCGTLLTLVFPS